MRQSRIANLLLSVGAIVGVSAAVGLAVGFQPSQLPDSLLDIAAYKLTFITAGVLLAAGALLARYQRRKTRAELASAADTSDRQLVEPSPLDTVGRSAAEREPSSIPRDGPHGA